MQGANGKPIIVLLNQIGPPRAADAERADEERWRRHLEPFGIVGDVLTLDAFARCWVHERVCCRGDAGCRQRSAAMPRRRWTARSIDRFTTSMRVLAEQLVQIARDCEPVAVESATAMQKVLRSVGVGREGDATRETAMAALAARLDVQIRATTDRLIELHGLHGSAAQTVLERMRANFATKERVDEGEAALWGSVAASALTAQGGPRGGTDVRRGHAGRRRHRRAHRRGRRTRAERALRRPTTRSSLVGRVPRRLCALERAALSRGRALRRGRGCRRRGAAF
jgi:hypothetical protein